MIKNVTEFNKELVAALVEKNIPVSIPTGYEIEQMPNYLNIESKEREYLTMDELVESIDLIVRNYPELNSLDKIMATFEDFTLIQNITSDQELVTSVLDYDSISEKPLFGNISNLMWSAFIDDSRVVNHLKDTKLVLFDYDKTIALIITTA